MNNSMHKYLITNSHSNIHELRERKYMETMSSHKNQHLRRTRWSTCSIFSSAQQFFTKRGTLTSRHRASWLRV